MRRTAADFAREAADDGEFELEVGTGPKARVTKPLPMSDMTYDQQKEHARLLDVWAAAMNTDPPEVPRLPSGAAEMEPVEFTIRFRFGAVKPRQPGDADPRMFEPKQSADYDAFKREIWDELAWSQVSRILRAVDAHYDPTPTTDADRAAADADPDGDAAGKSDGDATS